MADADLATAARIQQLAADRYAIARVHADVQIGPDAFEAIEAQQIAAALSANVRRRLGIETDEGDHGQP